MASRKIGFILLGMTLLLAACEGNTASPPTQNLQPVTSQNVQIVTGQLVYVPAYSEIFYGSPVDRLPLTVTLAIHNSDPENPIIVSSVRYYDTDGNLVRDYVEQSAQVPPLATVGFVVEDTAGGWGANFLVEWGAEQPVYEPVIEAVMVSRRGTEGVSFISDGRVLSETR
ncbi:MAG: DUF3124 domain-containing protein [bacterium]|nr:DUF3124 domain-containing protein [bacterium]